jgi:2-polyprenyl-3-methyl-5-hydroxy-6-metoxy-1,4-benzoquinol methylase
MFLDANFSAEQLTRLYSDHYPRSSFRLEDYKPHEERSGFMAWLDGAGASAFRWVPRNVRVLDIGCGFGETLGYHKARGCDVYGVEADENIRRVSESFGFNVHVGLFNAEDYAPSSFDYVTMDQVLEHVANPLEVLRGVAKVLKPGGLAIVSVPNVSGWGAWVFGRRWINWHAPYHMQFYSVPSMQQATKLSSLAIEHTETVTSSAWLYYQWLHLLTYPSEGTPSKFWARVGNLSFVQKAMMKFLDIIHHAKFNHLITRMIDASGKGDNRLFIIRKS